MTVVKSSTFVKSQSIQGAVSATIGNFDPLYSNFNYPRHAVCLSRTFIFTYGSN